MSPVSPVPLQCESIAEEYEDELIEFLSHEAENVKDRLCSKRTGELGGSGGSAAHPGLVAAPSVLEWEEMRFQPRAGAVPGVSPVPEAEAAPSVLGWEEALARSRGCPWGSLLLSQGVSPAVWGSLLLPWCWDGRRY